MALLRTMLGPDARFRDGQLEAVRAVVEDRSRLLVVQRTGWGKSIVYFIATKLLRCAGSGPTLLVSPLLSLMDNQIAMAERIGVQAHTMNSGNRGNWKAVQGALAADACDVLLISPERLGDANFVRRILPAIRKGIGLVVVDEAHCISDWGHDFRPDYRRIVRLLRFLPPGVPVVATTATANDRVIRDVETQLGPDLGVLRGALSRASLRIQAIPLADQAERLAWMAEHLPSLPGSGIIYCLTVRDCDRVAAWLRSRGLTVEAYHAQLPNPTRRALAQKLLSNELKALVATVALGMGFDKPDLGFVVHYQRPGSVVAYYQQIGRAGRALDDAHAILLHGREDDTIQEWFIRNAFPPPDAMVAVLGALSAAAVGLERRALEKTVNLSRKQIDQCLKHLVIEGAVAQDGTSYSRTAVRWAPDVERADEVTAIRRRELARMRELVAADRCLMEFVVRDLDDPGAAPCGRCAVCAGDLVSRAVAPSIVAAAIDFLKAVELRIRPHKRLPDGGSIKRSVRLEEGRALAEYNDAGWGRLVVDGKYRDDRFGDELVAAAASLVRERWNPTPPLQWVTAVPSRNTGDLVPDFARRLATRLDLPYKDVLRKTRDTEPQKAMQNAAQQVGNVKRAFEVVGDILPGAVLLVDDVVDSGWTFAVCGAYLRRAGAGPVYPFALAMSTPGG